MPRDLVASKNVILGKIDTFKDTIQAVCRKCERPFPRQHTGEWVAKYPSRDTAGYSMSRLDILDQPLNDLYVEWILAQGNTSKISTFYTSVLGMPFEYAGARISSEMLANCYGEYCIDYGGSDDYKDELMSMGIDVGSLLHVTVSKTIRKDDEVQRQTVLIMTVKNFSELQDIIERFHVDTVVIDSMPETRKAQELRDWGINNGIYVWLCKFYPTARVGNEKYGRKLDWRTKTVTVDRTQIMDATFDDIRFKKRQLPEDVVTILGYHDQMKAPVRVLDEHKSRIVWAEGNAPDHFRLSDVYDKIAHDLCSMSGTFGTF